MVYPHGLARPHRAHGANHSMDSAGGRSPRIGLAAQHARLDDFEETLLGTRAAYLGLRRVRAFYGDRESRRAERSRGWGLGVIRRQFAAPTLYRCGQDKV